MMIRTIIRPHLVENAGSTARDYCMLERNLLSHIKLALLLTLLAASLLLSARLVPPGEQDHESPGSIALASIESVTAIACMVAGCLEYYWGYRDIKNSRAFLIAVKPHLSIMSGVATVVFVTCIYFLVQDEHS
ncbi:hypothetical protein CPB83DRAFT_859641 [Crepidotus variabilis]|uniref:DUF202 domain-containing protein n=1 Tax=Crepidotus variabilis TaxID=179855 RepID=A0A9P6EA75_9AGAR|nr:hypothetical protein CPB83DRAFT_859641 [Crepidotus variabilis]